MNASSDPMAPPVCNTLLTFGIINSLYAVLGTKLFSERLPVPLAPSALRHARGSL